MGGQTLVGVNMYKPVYDENGEWVRNEIDHDRFPLKGGNCFSLIDPNGKYHSVVNFKAENLEEWVRRTGQTDIDVECIPKSDKIWMIVDKRIPQDWYSDRFCEVCTPYRMLPYEQRKDMFARSKVNQFRGPNGERQLIFSTPIVAKTRKLSTDWTIEFSDDVAAFCSVDAEADLKKLTGEMVLEEGFIYTPYIPRIKPPSGAVSTNYKKKIVNPNFYAKIIVKESENDDSGSSDNG